MKSQREKPTQKMSTEMSTDIYMEQKGQTKPIRPKLLKLPDESVPVRSRKKSKFKLKDLSQGKSERYADDPAYTEDVRHLAMPMRRNSGPESARRKSMSILDGPLFDKNSGISNNDLILSTKKKYSDSLKYDTKSKGRSAGKGNRLIRRNDDSSSSDDCNYNRRGQSLDRSIMKQQKRTFFFQRDRDGNNSNRRFDKTAQRKEVSMENLYSKSGRYSIEFSNQSRAYQDEFENARNNSKGQYLDQKQDSSIYNDQLERNKSKESSKFQIGKRFLRGEIGIKSFNYYLLKEGLKTNKKGGTKQQPSPIKPKISKSEENIYEELHFVDRKGAQKQFSYPDCELCIQECTNKNCEICKASAERAAAIIRTLPAKSKRASEQKQLTHPGRGKLSNSNEDLNLLSQIVPNVLQYQSYNPKNPGVYKIETTPVAFTSDYNPLEEIYNKQKYAQHKPVTNKKSSSSSDSLHHHKYPNVQLRTDYSDCPNDTMCNQQNLLKPQIYKTDSRASIISEMSIKSESSNRYYRPADMSDSSMGDSMFSYSQQRRYFGSAESCRFGYECRRCSYDGEKCFSDNCRYECRNCDCSSSYFSSDFDDGNFSRKSSARLSNQSQISYYDDIIDTKTSRYAEDFIKHVTNVKKSSIYQTVPQPYVTPTNKEIQSHLQKTKMGPGNQDLAYIKNNPVYGLNTSDYDTLSKDIYKQSTPRSPRRDKSMEGNGSKTSNTGDFSDTGTLRKEDTVDSKCHYNENKKASLSSKSSNSSKSDSSVNRATGTIPKSGQKSANSKGDDLKHLSPYKANPSGREENKRDGGETAGSRNKTNHPGIIDTKMFIKKPEIVDAPKIATRDRSKGYLSTDTDDDNDEVFEDEQRNETTQPPACNASAAKPNLPLAIEREGAESPAKVKTTTKTTQQANTDTTSVTAFALSSTATAPISTAAASTVLPAAASNIPSGLRSPLPKSPTNKSNSGTAAAAAAAVASSVAAAASTVDENRESNAKAIRSGNSTLAHADGSLRKHDIDDVVPNADPPKSPKPVHSAGETKTYGSIGLESAGDTSNRHWSNQNTPAQPQTNSSQNVQLNESKQRNISDILDLPAEQVKKENITQIKPHHYTLPTNFKQRKRDHRKNAKSERTVTDQSTGDTQNTDSKMHYRNSGDVPKYLFGERVKQHHQSNVKDDEIYLNKSGWVQVSQRQLEKHPMRNDGHYGYAQSAIKNFDDSRTGATNLGRDSAFYQYGKNYSNLSTNLNANQSGGRLNTSKIEALIMRNEARRADKKYAEIKHSIDPQVSALLSERPGFLPIKRFNENESPPPITPIISPPPAFQDSNINSKQKLNFATNTVDNTSNKGMVFSRSFEYDNRKSHEYNQTFSKSFDYDFSSPVKEEPTTTYTNDRIFTNLTGISPNYLSKKPNPSRAEPNANQNRDKSSIYQQYLEPKTYAEPNIKSRVRNTYSLRPEVYSGSQEQLVDRPRRSQFLKQESTPVLSSQGFRAQLHQSVVNKRLNSCDSGARSDLSNDEVDDEDQPPNKAQRSRYLASQQHSLIRKQRSLTPENHSEDSNVKPRALTPEKRSLKSTLDVAQGSNLTKESPSSRTNTLERPTGKYKEKPSSRSSSSSSYSGPEQETQGYRRVQHRQNGRSIEESRIRRSRSLQLSERSPNRMQPSHKVVVKLGNVLKERPSYQQVRNTPTAPATSRANTRQRQPVERYTAPPKDTRNLDLEKSRSLDSDYEQFNKYSSNTDFDKSRSFDDDYNERGNGANKYLDDGRSFSNDQVYSKNPASNAKQTSPQSYGSRLYDHEMMYDMARKVMERSPILEFRRQQQLQRQQNRNRDRSPNSNSDQMYRMNRSFEQPPPSNQSRRDQSPSKIVVNHALMGNHPSPGTEYDGPAVEYETDFDPRMNEELIKEAKIVTEFLYGNKAKAEALLNQRRREAKPMSQIAGTPSSGSCTVSSCELWPHCGVTGYHNNSAIDYSQQQQQQHQKLKRNQMTFGCNLSDSVPNLSDNNVGPKKQFTSHGDLAVAPENRFVARSESVDNKLLLSKPPIYEKFIRNGPLLLMEEREMPITRDRQTKTAMIVKRPGDINKSSKWNAHINSSRAITNDKNNDLSMDRFKIRSPLIGNRRVASNRKEHVWEVVRSRSLPKSFMRNSCANQRENHQATDIHLPDLSRQMRAVSSPSLSDNPMDQPINGKVNGEPLKIHENHPSNVSASVLQKFKKTFSQFKGGKSNGTSQSTSTQLAETTTSITAETATTTPTTMSAVASDTTKYRFGPLIWRSSKERRKTKHHRRDKCNSGDSGIQVELENDENIHDGLGSVETSPSFNARVRRANSAKVTSTTSASTVKSKAFRKNEGFEKIYSTPLPGRSLSQPYGLDQIPRDPDDSDTDSEYLLPEQTASKDPHRVYAEVLFPFKAGGPQELCLDKGALVEVLRVEPGPWWWGRIQHDAILTSKTTNQLEGWFPKDFVKVIDPFPHPNKKPNTQKPFLVEATNCDIDFLRKSNSVNCAKTSDGESPTSTSPQYNETMRDNVMRELLETEENYVKLLASICLGYLKELRQRPDVFPTESLILIFSNIEKIYRFQERFLDALRFGSENKRIAETFLEYQSDFMVYSTYCNSYPRALMELELYTGNVEAAALLESCRVSQNLPELPLSAHLLAPIQRICRYPLHLSELVKHSPMRIDLNLQCDGKSPKLELEIIDCKESFEMALGAMKRVTEMVNEGKRHSEYLSRIQARFDSYQGPPISIHSTRLFLQIDAIRMTPNIWNNTYTLFLFDRQLIYCKKDLLKRTQYIYKGRIFLDNCRILNLPDGKIFGVTLKNALRIYCDTRNKWLDFCFRSSSAKLRFLNTLSAERQFCGQSLFVSELAGMDDENMSEREYTASGTDFSKGQDMTDGTDDLLHCSERAIDVENLEKDLTPNGDGPQPIEPKSKKSDTLPKKSRKLTKEQTQTSYEYNTNSLGRKRIGNWFRKAKSTNSTPSQSPTHHPMVTTAASDSSSQSSPSLGIRPANKPKLKESNGTTS